MPNEVADTVADDGRIGDEPTERRTGDDAPEPCDGDSAPVSIACGSSLSCTFVLLSISLALDFSMALR